MPPLLDRRTHCLTNGVHFSAIYPSPILGTAYFAGDISFGNKRERAYIQPWIEYNDKFENRLSRSYHYTFGDYVNSIVKAGLVVQEVQEPLPPESWKLTNPGRYDSFVETPTYMIWKLEKQAAL